MAEGITAVKHNIDAAFGRRKAAATLLCRKYARLAESTLKNSQGNAQGEGQFWTNQTSNAINTVFGFTEDHGDSVAFGIAHRMEYGYYLEFANNRKHAALGKTLRVLVPFFMDEVRKVYAE